MRILLKHGDSPEDRSMPRGIAKEEMIEAMGNFRRDLPQCLLRSGSGRAFNGEMITKEMMEFL